MDQSLPKYVNSPETDVYSKGRNLYGLFQARKAIREKDSVIVVEGYMDLIACHQAGIENVVASLGTALTTEQVKLIKRNTNNVFILYDADAAGEMATLRGLELFLEEGLGVKIVRLLEGHDPDSYLREFGVEKFQTALANAKTLFEYRLSLLKQTFDAGSLEGKVKIANEMVSLFSKVQNEILKSAWTKELAGSLKLSEESLQAEMRKTERRVKNFAQEERPAAGPKTDFQSVEKLLIGLLVDNPDLIPEAKSHISEEDFQSHETRSLAKRLFTAPGTAANAAQWISVYKDEPHFVHLISLACAEMDTVQDKKKTFEDCLLWIKRSRIKSERENLKSQIIAAEREGDKNRISKLMFDFTELNKGIKKINEKR
jgi:DNA primase